MGDRPGGWRCSGSRCSSSGRTASRRRRADLLPRDRRAALLLLVHRRGRSRWRTCRSPRREQARFDPMITGFNPTDMYAADHIRRVLRRSPASSPASASSRSTRSSSRRRSPATSRASRTPRSTGSSTSPDEVGLVVLIHNDIDTPFPEAGRRRRSTSSRSTALFRRHPKTTIIWAHVGRRPRRPARSKNHAAHARRASSRIPTLAHVYFDISWTEVAKYLVATPGGDRSVAARPHQALPRPLPLRHRRGRAHGPGQDYLRVYKQYEPLLQLLEPRRARSSARATTSGSSTRRDGACARGRRRNSDVRPATPRREHSYARRRWSPRSPRPGPPGRGLG